MSTPVPMTLLQVKYIQQGNEFYKVLVPKNIDNCNGETLIPDDDNTQGVNPIICQVQNASQFKTLCQNEVAEKPCLTSFVDLSTEFKSLKSLVKLKVKDKSGQGDAVSNQSKTQSTPVAPVQSSFIDLTESEPPEPSENIFKVPTPVPEQLTANQVQYNPTGPQKPNLVSTDQVKQNENFLPNPPPAQAHITQQNVAKPMPSTRIRRIARTTKSDIREVSTSLSSRANVPLSAPKNLATKEFLSKASMLCSSGKFPLRKPTSDEPKHSNELSGNVIRPTITLLTPAQTIEKSQQVHPSFVESDQLKIPTERPILQVNQVSSSWSTTLPPTTAFSLPPPPYPANRKSDHCYFVGAKNLKGQPLRHSFMTKQDSLASLIKKKNNPEAFGKSVAQPPNLTVTYKPKALQSRIKTVFKHGSVLMKLSSPENTVGEGKSIIVYQPNVKLNSEQGTGNVGETFVDGGNAQDGPFLSIGPAWTVNPENRDLWPAAAPDKQDEVQLPAVDFSDYLKIAPVQESTFSASPDQLVSKEEQKEYNLSILDKGADYETVAESCSTNTVKFGNSVSNLLDSDLLRLAGIDSITQNSTDVSDSDQRPHLEAAPSMPVLSPQLLARLTKTPSPSLPKPTEPEVSSNSTTRRFQHLNKLNQGINVPDKLNQGINVPDKLNQGINLPEIKDPDINLPVVKLLEKFMSDRKMQNKTTSSSNVKASTGLSSDLMNNRLKNSTSTPLTTGTFNAGSSKASTGVNSDSVLKDSVINSEDASLKKIPCYLQGVAPKKAGDGPSKVTKIIVITVKNSEDQVMVIQNSNSEGQVASQMLVPAGQENDSTVPVSDSLQHLLTRVQNKLQHNMPELEQAGVSSKNVDDNLLLASNSLEYISPFPVTIDDFPENPDPELLSAVASLTSALDQQPASPVPSESYTTTRLVPVKRDLIFTHDGTLDKRDLAYTNDGTVEKHIAASSKMTPKKGLKFEGPIENQIAALNAFKKMTSNDQIKCMTSDSTINTNINFSSLSLLPCNVHTEIQNDCLKITSQAISYDKQLPVTFGMQTQNRLEQVLTVPAEKRSIFKPVSTEEKHLTDPISAGMIKIKTEPIDEIIEEMPSLSAVECGDKQPAVKTEPLDTPPELSPLFGTLNNQKDISSLYEQAASLHDSQPSTQNGLVAEPSTQNELVAEPSPELPNKIRKSPIKSSKKIPNRQSKNARTNLLPNLPSLSLAMKKTKSDSTPKSTSETGDVITHKVPASLTSKVLECRQNVNKGHNKGYELAQKDWGSKKNEESEKAISFSNKKLPLFKTAPAKELNLQQRKAVVFSPEQSKDDPVASNSQNPFPNWNPHSSTWNPHFIIKKEMSQEGKDSEVKSDDETTSYNNETTSSDELSSSEENAEHRNREASLNREALQKVKKVSHSQSVKKGIKSAKKDYHLNKILSSETDEKERRKFKASFQHEGVEKRKFSQLKLVKKGANYFSSSDADESTSSNETDEECRKIEMEILAERIKRNKHLSKIKNDLVQIWNSKYYYPKRALASPKQSTSSLEKKTKNTSQMISQPKNTSETISQPIDLETSSSETDPELRYTLKRMITQNTFEKKKQRQAVYLESSSSETESCSPVKRTITRSKTVKKAQPMQFESSSSESEPESNLAKKTITRQVVEKATQPIYTSPSKDLIGMQTKRKCALNNNNLEASPDNEDRNCSRTKPFLDRKCHKHEFQNPTLLNDTFYKRWNWITENVENISAEETNLQPERKQKDYGHSLKKAIFDEIFDEPSSIQNTQYDIRQQDQASNTLSNDSDDSLQQHAETNNTSVIETQHKTYNSSNEHVKKKHYQKKAQDYRATCSSSEKDQKNGKKNNCKSSQSSSDLNDKQHRKQKHDHKMSHSSSKSTKEKHFKNKHLKKVFQLNKNKHVNACRPPSQKTTDEAGYQKKHLGNEHPVKVSKTDYRLKELEVKQSLTEVVPSDKHPNKNKHLLKTHATPATYENVTESSKTKTLIILHRALQQKTDSTKKNTLNMSEQMLGKRTKETAEQIHSKNLHVKNRKNLESYFESESLSSCTTSTSKNEQKCSSDSKGFNLTNNKKTKKKCTSVDLISYNYKGIQPCFVKVCRINPDDYLISHDPVKRYHYKPTIKNIPAGKKAKAAAKKKGTKNKGKKKTNNSKKSKRKHNSINNQPIIKLTPLNIKEASRLGSCIIYSPETTPEKTCDDTNSNPEKQNEQENFDLRYADLLKLVEEKSKQLEAYRSKFGNVC